MSFDLMALSGKKPLTHPQAAGAYQLLCDDPDAWRTLLKPDEAIAAFVEEITTRWPQIDDLPRDQVDFSRWAVAFDLSPAHLISCIGWDSVDEVVPVYVRKALGHGLYVYDPQEDALREPAERST